MPARPEPLPAHTGSDRLTVNSTEASIWLAALRKRSWSEGSSSLATRTRLIAAYHDEEGVTAEFVLNALRVLNRELGADFDLDGFSYIPFWDAHMERMDLRVRSEMPQRVTIPGADLVLEVTERYAPIPLFHRPDGSLTNW